VRRRANGSIFRPGGHPDGCRVECPSAFLPCGRLTGADPGGPGASSPLGLAGRAASPNDRASADVNTSLVLFAYFLHLVGAADIPHP